MLRNSIETYPDLYSIYVILETEKTMNNRFPGWNFLLAVTAVWTPMPNSADSLDQHA